MNEPKKRGRPPKVSNFAPAAGVGEKVDEVTFHRDPAQAQLAQSYALRVWNGQSPSAMTREERIVRVKQALEGQGLPFEGVVLP